jgi:glycosyltransferase involved in cell wall biosynthesis
VSCAVLHIINRLSPMAGAEKQVTGLVGRSNLSSRLIELGDTDEESSFRVLARLRASIREFGPRVIVAWLDRAQIAVSLSAPRDCSIVASVRAPAQRREGIRRWTLRTAFRRFDAFVANSEALRRATTEFSGAARQRPFAVIPNGLDVSSPGPSAGREARQTFRVGYLGRVNRWKGADILVDAIRLLPSTDLTASFVGAGAHELGAANPDIGDRCDFSSHSEDPWTDIGPIDALVVPSRVGSEGSPNVILEAFARGVPVIGTNDPPIRELLEEDRGLIVPASDPRALAAAITEVRLDERAARARAERAQAFVRQEHGWSQVVSAWDRFLSEVGNLSPAGPARRSTATVARR